MQQHEYNLTVIFRLDVSCHDGVVRFEERLANVIDDPSEHSSVENRRTCQRSLITYHGCHSDLDTSLSQEPQNATSYPVGRWYTCCS